LAESLAVLTPFVATAALALYVLLPLGLISPLGLGALVPALVLLYGSIAAALRLLYLRRAALALTRGQCAVLAFECLACPPFGVNLVRRIALAKRCAVRFPDAAVRLLEPPRWQALERELEAQLGEELAAPDLDDADRSNCSRASRSPRSMDSRHSSRGSRSTCSSTADMSFGPSSRRSFRSRANRSAMPSIANSCTTTARSWSKF
jgi:hypothetical protein